MPCIHCRQSGHVVSNCSLIVRDAHRNILDLEHMVKNEDTTNIVVFRDRLNAKIDTFSLPLMMFMVYDIVSRTRQRMDLDLENEPHLHITEYIVNYFVNVWIVHGWKRTRVIQNIYCLESAVMEDCAVCFGPSHIKTQCGHSFCKCIVDWTEKKKQLSCPNCRTKITSLTYYPV